MKKEKRYFVVDKETGEVVWEWDTPFDKPKYRIMPPPLRWQIRNLRNNKKSLRWTVGKWVGIVGVISIFLIIPTLLLAYLDILPIIPLMPILAVLGLVGSWLGYALLHDAPDQEKDA